MKTALLSSVFATGNLEDKSTRGATAAAANSGFVFPSIKEESPKSPINFSPQLLSGAAVNNTLTSTGTPAMVPVSAWGNASSGYGAVGARGKGPIMGRWAPTAGNAYDGNESDCSDVTEEPAAAPMITRNTAANTTASTEVYKWLFRTTNPSQVTVWATADTATGATNSVGLYLPTSNGPRY